MATRYRGRDDQLQGGLTWHSTLHPWCGGGSLDKQDSPNGPPTPLRPRACHPRAPISETISDLLTMVPISTAFGLGKHSNTSEAARTGHLRSSLGGLPFEAESHTDPGSIKQMDTWWLSSTLAATGVTRPWKPKHLLCTACKYSTPLLTISGRRLQTAHCDFDTPQLLHELSWQRKENSGLLSGIILLWQCSLQFLERPHMVY